MFEYSESHWSIEYLVEKEMSKEKIKQIKKRERLPFFPEKNKRLWQEENHQ